MSVAYAAFPSKSSWSGITRICEYLRDSLDIPAGRAAGSHGSAGRRVQQSPVDQAQADE